MYGYRRHTVLGAAIGAALWADDLVDVIMELGDIPTSKPRITRLMALCTCGCRSARAHHGKLQASA